MVQQDIDPFLCFPGISIGKLKGDSMFKFISLAVLSVTALEAFATSPVIYGDDNRQEVYEASALHQKLAQSAISMIEKTKLTRSPEKPGLVQIEQKTLRAWLEAQFEEEKSVRLSKSAQEAVDEKVTFCQSERFTEQPNPAECSGFLVGPDLIVTAGHCVAIPDFCSNYSWVLDFKIDPQTKTAGIDVKEENVFNCKKVISTVLNNGMGLDYGLVQLDRKITDREALTIRSEGMLPNSSPLMVIGNPSGLPLKIAPGARIRANSHPFYFSANLDTFQGNSGSAVLNSEDGTVEGILVRGEEDFEANTGLMCIEAKRCDDSGCRGEDVSRMTSIPEFAVKDALFRTAEKGDLKELQKLLKTKFWIDIYGKDGKTALMKAALNKKNVFVKVLIEKGADVTLEDTDGNSALHSAAIKLSKKNSDIVNMLVEAGAKIEARNLLGETALLVAAKNLNLEAVKILIKSGADKNALDKNNESALFPFARKGDKRAVKELIDLGIDVSVKNGTGQSIHELEGSPINA
jgi:V8-like Glu-specific endopeptidase